MATSNTQRTLRELRNRGRIAGIVERWNQFAGPHGIRQDLFGFIDIIAIGPVGGGIIGVQSCGSDFAAHLRKITDSDCTTNAIEWLRAGGRIELWGWRKVKLHRGSKAMRWKPRIKEITLSDIVPDQLDRQQQPGILDHYLM